MLRQSKYVRGERKWRFQSHQSEPIECSIMIEEFYDVQNYVQVTNHILISTFIIIKKNPLFVVVRWQAVCG